jgi:hypothetical protein
MVTVAGPAHSGYRAEQVQKRREDAYALQKLARNRAGVPPSFRTKVLSECDESSHRFDRSRKNPEKALND